MATPEQKARALADVCLALEDAIKASGEHGIPSGHLYAMLMGKMSLDTYNFLIDILIRSGKITNNGHLLKAK